MKLVPLDEAARQLGIDRTTLYRWIRKGEVKRYKGGLGDPRTYVELAALRQLRKPQASK